MPEEQKSYEPTNLAIAATTAKSTPESVLENLQGVQGETSQLLSILESRLRPVSETTLNDSPDKNPPSGFIHVFQALENQYDVNRTLRKLIDELKV